MLLLSKFKRLSMKIIISILFLNCCIYNLQAQEYEENLKTANMEIFFLTDSLWQIEKLYTSKIINESTYLKISGDLLNAISAVAYSNASNYTRPNEPNETEVVEEIVNEEMFADPVNIIDLTDTVPQDFSFEQGTDYNPPQNPITLITGSGRRTSFKIRYGLFWSGLTLNKEQSGVNYPDFKLWNSFCWFSEFDILLQTRLGASNRGPLTVYYGIGWDYRKLTQKDNALQLSLDQEKASFTAPPNKLEEANLNLGYFKIPVGIQYKKKSLAINMGGYVGIMIRHKQSLEYKTSLDEVAELILDKDYNFEKTIYGLSASIGLKRLHLAFNYDLNTLFKKNDNFDYNAWKIGIMIF